jgi:methionyl-tRNA synthetase
MEHLSIATSIMYPNGTPHMGHALEIVQADVVARYYRHFTDTAVWFQTGTDEHGMKMFRAAEAAGMDTAAFVAERVAAVQDLYQKLQSSHDVFIRTTSPEHHAMAQALWRKVADAGYLEKRTYRAWYNVKQEEFLGSCDEHPDPAVFNIDPSFIEKIEEENYFFLASKVTEKLIALLEQGNLIVRPQHRVTELVNILRTQGMHDVSVSRQASRLPWGIPVPGDDGQVMYVWFDALSNYLTGTASLSDTGEILPAAYWPTGLHVIGKDIQRFHALLWPAMLMAADITLPRELLVHGFVLSGGRVMSKSLGNGIDPEEFLETYGSDALRWYLTAALPTMDDGEVTRERFADIYNSELRNTYGNLVHRVTTMVGKYCGGVLPHVQDGYGGDLGATVVAQMWQGYHKEIREHRALDGAAASLKDAAQWANQRIEERAPWTLAKQAASGDAAAQHELEALLHELCQVLCHISIGLQPFIPHTSRRVLHEVFCVDSEQIPRADLPYHFLQPGCDIRVPSEVLFAPVA